jgi:uncharacterized protein (DUF2147 family)
MNRLKLLSVAMNSQHASYRSSSPNPLPRAVGLAALFMVLIWQPAAAGENDIVGTWLTGDGDGWVDVVHSGNGISGFVAGSPNDRPDRSKVDDKNPDPALRDRELLGLELFAGFHFDGDDRWIGGTIYDPNSGKTYRCIITILDENKLKVRGYIGIPMLGRTEIWTRKKS